MEQHLKRLSVVKDYTCHQNFSTILGHEKALEISEKEEKTHGLYLLNGCVY